MNIYQMYYKNDKKFGFWVIRQTWGNTIAKVTSIEGVEEGKGMKGGKYPYFKNQEVQAEIYKIDEEGIYTYHSTEKLSCPSNYSYSMIEI